MLSIFVSFLVCKGASQYFPIFFPYTCTVYLPAGPFTKAAAVLCTCICWQNFNKCEIEKKANSVARPSTNQPIKVPKHLPPLFLLFFLYGLYPVYMNLQKTSVTVLPKVLKSDLIKFSIGHIVYCRMYSVDLQLQIFSKKYVEPGIGWFYFRMTKKS